jgi:hypothetical protein
MPSQFRAEHPTQARTTFLSVVQQFNVGTLKKDSSNRSRRSTNRSVAGSSGFNSPAPAMLAALDETSFSVADAGSGFCL